MSGACSVSHIKEQRVSGTTPGFTVQAGGGDDAEMSQDSSRVVKQHGPKIHPGWGFGTLRRGNKMINKMEN